ncbi:MAG: transglycosylase SLT domain-containing protein [Thiotrichaceae bacterium]|nr:transglycosylase SLT domain-containing protein [Thiotrichaceae bacterium]
MIFPIITLAEPQKHVKHKHVKDKYWTKKYDRHFKKNSKHYFGPAVNWRLFKAQAIAESNLNPKAVSHKGALGIMQIMPRTYKEIITKKTNFGKINEPRWNIAAAIYYNRQLYKRWTKKNISTEERMNFMFASYNAGFYNILKARKKLRKTLEKDNVYTEKIVREWEHIAPFVPSQTRHYVRKINCLMDVKK